jgi:hypothetical protein
LQELKERDITCLRPGDAYYPQALQGRSDATIYVKGDARAINASAVTFLPSIKPSDREIQAVLACVREIACPSVSVLVGYSARVERPAIRIALEQGAHVIICVTEGILLFNVRKDLRDIWDESRVSIISAAKPNQKWYSGNAGRATAVKLALGSVAVVSDPTPTWLRNFARDDAYIPERTLFVLDYGEKREEIARILNRLNARRIRRSRCTGRPNVREIMDIIREHNERGSVTEAHLMPNQI